MPDRRCQTTKRQCSRAGKIERGGKYYCWQHDPRKLQEKRDAWLRQEEIRETAHHAHNAKYRIGEAYLNHNQKALREAVSEYRRLERKLKELRGH